MAGPCGFEYTNPKSGKKHYYKTIEEYVEGILSGFIDISSNPELKAKVEKILGKNKDIMNAVYDAADKAKNKKELFAQSLSNLNKIITESITEDNYTKQDIKKITRAALAIGLKPNLNIAIKNFVETLNNINSSAQERSNEETVESDRQKAINQITSAKKTSSPYYVKTLLDVLKVPFSEVPKTLKQRYQELVSNIIKPTEENITIEELTNRAKILSEEIKLELVGDQMELDSLLSRVDEYIENKDVSTKTFKEVVADMLKDGFIDSEEQTVLNSLTEQQSGVIVKSTTPLTEEKRTEIKDQINDNIDVLKSSLTSIQDSFDRTTRDFIDFILKNTNDGFLNSLKDNELKNLFNTLDALRLGYNSSSLKNIKVKLDAYTRAELIASELENASKTTFFRPFARVKSGVKRIFGDKTNYKEQLFRNHLKIALDTILGVESEDNPVYSNLFGKSASSYGGYETIVSNIETNFINPAAQIIKNIGGKTVRGTTEARIRIGIYLVDAMNIAGIPNSPKVKEYFKDILEREYQVEDDAYSKSEKEILKDNLEKYEDAISKGSTPEEMAELAKSFLSEQELQAAESILEAIRAVQSDAMSLSYYFNGKTLVPDSAGAEGKSVYFPINFKSKSENKQQSAEELFQNQEKEFLQPGFSANHLKEKAGVTSPKGKVLDILDPVGIALSYVKEITKKSQLQSEVATTLRTFDLLEKKFDSGSTKDGVFLSSMFKMAKATYIDRVRNIVAEGSLSNSPIAKFEKNLRGAISTALLTGISKFAGDVVGNIINSLQSPKDFTNGANLFLKYRSKHNNIMQNLKVPEGKRLLIQQTGEGFAADIEASGVGKRGSRIRLEENELLGDLKLKYGQPFIDFLNSINENQIKAPDQLTSIPIFYGALERNFRRITGEEINFDKINDNDVEYFGKYGDAISKAVISAHTESVSTVGTKNPFIIPSKTVLKEGGKASIENFTKEWLNFFKQYESAMGTAILTAKGADKLTTIAVRGLSSSAYGAIVMGVSGAMISYLNNLLNGQELEPNEEEKVKSGMREIVNTGINLFTLNSNNLTKQIVSYGVEYLNEKYGEGITREGEITKEKKISPYSIYEVKGKDQEQSASSATSKIITKATGSTGLAIDVLNDVAAVYDEKEIVPKSLAGTSVALRVLKVPLGKDLKRIVDSYRYDFIYNKAEIEKIKGKTTEEERRVYNKKLKDYLKGKFYSMFFLEYSPEKSVYDNKNEVSEANKKHQQDVEKVLDPKIVDKVTGRSQFDENKNLYYKLFLQEKIANTKEMPLNERVRLIRSIEDTFINNDRVIVGDKLTMNMVKEKIQEAKKKGFSENKDKEIESEKKSIDTILNGYTSGQYNEKELFFLLDNFTNEKIKYDESEEYLREKLKKNEFKDLKYE